MENRYIEFIRSLMKHSFLLVLLLAGAHASFSQNAEKFAGTISADELRKNLEIVASDALEGRQTGSTGEKMAAAFIASKFEQAGLTSITGDNYLQPFKLFSVAANEVYINSAKNSFNNYGSIVFFGVSGTKGELSTDLVFAGAGGTEELAAINVRDKAALLWLDTLDSDAIGSVVSSMKEAGAKLILLHSPKGTGDFPIFAKQMSQLFSAGNVSLQPLAAPDAPLLFFVDKSVVESFFGNPDKLKKRIKDAASLAKVKIVPIKVKVDVQSQTIKTQNVLGFMEGSDLKNEVLVITAHHDHVGLTSSGNDRVNNGADDDGSGTVTVIQLANAFSKAKREGLGPRRSILFMTVSAEEQGLYGSQWYTDYAPVMPLQSTIANLNIDMIGRVDPEHKGKGDYVYVVGSDRISRELHEISERANSSFTKLYFDYTYNDEHHPTNIYKRSDHWNFAKHGVPIIFYFDGIHEDYHQPSDEVDKIDFNLLAKRAQCVFYTAWELANRDTKPRVDN